jgi:tRNA threonylcarbamoyladenosine biosynthesis protein TsaB
VPSLREVVQQSGSVLVLDAAGAGVQAGWAAEHAPSRWVSFNEEAGAAVFRALEVLEVSVDSVGAFVYCEGPGSILGIRTVAMALRTWRFVRERPLFAYRSLELLASADARPDVTYIADARKQSWHTLRLGPDGRPGPLRRQPPDQLPGPLAMPAGFRTWSPLPAEPVEPLPYELGALWDACGAFPWLLRATAEPDAFQHEDPTYATWTPVVHQMERK